MYYLDTCTCIEFMRGNMPNVYRLFQRSDPRMFSVPSVVAAELYTGALKSKNPTSNRLIVSNFLLPFQIAPFDEPSAIHYADIRAYLEQKGMKIGPNDLMIAAIARANSGVLVTNNTKEFERVPGLSVESWAEVEF